VTDEWGILLGLLELMGLNLLTSYCLLFTDFIRQAEGSPFSSKLQD
jgi:hypothetical protein